MKVKEYSAVIYQFAILGVLGWALYSGIETETVIGAFIGLAVGIGLNTIKE